MGIGPWQRHSWAGGGAEGREGEQLAGLPSWPRAAGEAVLRGPAQGSCQRPGPGPPAAGEGGGHSAHAGDQGAAAKREGRERWGPFLPLKAAAATVSSAPAPEESQKRLASGHGARPKAFKATGMATRPGQH